MEKKELLLNSWRRSQTYGIDPNYPEDEVLTDRRLKAHQERLSTLFSACKHVLNDLYNYLRRSLFMVVISDIDGYIVYSKGDPPFINRAKSASLQLGANWSERFQGTNGIGTALIERTPLHIIGNEHYLKRNQFLTCYAAPLYDAKGNLLGILDVSGDAHMHHPHTFGMVIAAAEACQSKLLLQNLKHELTLRIQEAKIISKHGNAFMTVDHDGLITRINKHAAKILGETEEKCIGQPLTTWFEQKDVDQILASRKKKSSQVKMKTNNSRWFVEAIKDQRKRTYRSVLTLPANTFHSRNQNLNDNQTIWHCQKAYQSLQLARNIAPTNASIYIHGETGTGKEVIAQEIHRYSGRTGPLVTVNCGAIPKSLIESELFGYEKGAFTGAHKKGQLGKFRAADQGTLFLDEIGDMPLSAQAVLLRVLEEKRVTPIGANKSIPIDVRIITATNRNLANDIQKQKFRADLYYRLCEIELLLPPLRKRGDLFHLSDYFLKEIAREINVNHFILSDTVKKHMQTYDWPGNIRELRHTLRQAAYQAFFQHQSTIIHREHIRFLSQTTKQTETIHDEEAMIERAILETHGNLSKAAKIIGISRSTIYRKLNDYPRLKQLREDFKSRTD